MHMTRKRSLASSCSDVSLLPAFAFNMGVDGGHDESRRISARALRSSIPDYECNGQGFNSCL